MSQQTTLHNILETVSVFASPEKVQRQFPEHCVVLCVVTVEKVLINTAHKNELPPSHSNNLP